jgi:uncharacterized protein YdeI (YjbR/CyaY-like superfamily)
MTEVSPQVRSPWQCGGMVDTLPQRGFASAAAFSSWLRKNHDKSPGLWLKLAKKGAGAQSLSYAEAVEVLLIWGWIDGQKQALDDDFWLQKVTPRRKKSIWSQINRQKALSLIAAKRMEAPGLAEVERARADGRWDNAYASAKVATVPDDLATALAKNAKARAFFEKLDAANRYAILFRVTQAAQPKTREARIARFVEMLAQHRKIHTK